MSTRKLNQTIYILLFLVLLCSCNLIAVCFSQINPSNKSNMVTPKTSAGEITISTPENKTYTSPMSGYYSGSYSFDNDVPGTNPDGFTTNEPVGTSVQVISELDGHKNVVEIDDQNNAAGYPGITQYSLFPRTYGTIEFWVRFNNTVGVSAMASRDTAGDEVALALRVESGKWRYRIAGTSYNVPNVADPQTNTWYHIRIDFRCQGAPSYLGISQDRYIATINGISSGEIEHAHTGMADYSYFHVITDDTAEMKTWVDAIGFSWDPNYNIGDNLDEGLLLSFDTSFSPDWQGYSLNGMSNKTIIGNTTIPFPSDGLHNIQVFGNDSMGRDYKSDLRYFSTDTTPPTSILSFTAHEATNIVIASTTFTLTADDGTGSGVSLIRYKINDSTWIPYSGSFTLSGYDPGDYLITYQAIDNVGHIETEKTRIVELISISSPPDIPGYNLLIVIGTISIIGIGLIRKRFKS